MSPGLSARFSPYRGFWVVALVIFVSDQLTKAIIDSFVPFGTYFPGSGPGGASPIVVIPDFLQWVHIGNEGAAWGILDGQRIFLILVAVGALVAIYAFRGSLELKRPSMQICFGLIVGGVVGNLLDRAIYGHVVDFIDVHLPAVPLLGFDGYRWPAFNIADCGISVGVVSYVILSFFPPKQSSPGSGSLQSDESPS